MLSLCPLTLLPCTPLELIDAALDAGFDAIGVRLTPVLSTDIDVMADASLRRAIQARLSSTNLKVLDIEVVRISPATNVADLRPMLQYASDLGARKLAVTGVPRQDGRPDQDAATAHKLAELCEAAAGYGVQPMLEFMAFRSIGSLGEALRMRELVNDPNLGICIDALHVQRSGGSPAEIAATDQAALSCFQLCDAPLQPPDDLPKESRFGRLYPGEGGLPLREMLMALPADLPVGVETPDAARAHLPLLERAHMVARRARDVLAAAPRARNPDR
jgi:sugar phosphate isomerase/epimerase